MFYMALCWATKSVCYNRERVKDAVTLGVPLSAGASFWFGLFLVLHNCQLNIRLSGLIDFFIYSHRTCPLHVFACLPDMAQCPEPTDRFHILPRLDAFRLLVFFFVCLDQHCFKSTDVCRTINNNQSYLANFLL